MVSAPLLEGVEFVGVVFGGFFFLYACRQMWQVSILHLKWRVRESCEEMEASQTFNLIRSILQSSMSLNL